jgi:hypothetical protein
MVWYSTIWYNTIQPRYICDSVFSTCELTSHTSVFLKESMLYDKKYYWQSCACILGLGTVTKIYCQNEASTKLNATLGHYIPESCEWAQSTNSHGDSLSWKACGLLLYTSSEHQAIFQSFWSWSVFVKRAKEWFFNQFFAIITEASGLTFHHTFTRHVLRWAT